jgi:hypothetical protein
MRTPIFVSSLSLVIVVASAAIAQTGTQQSVPDTASPDAWLAEEQARFAQCLKDWDAKTRMTKRQWERTCRRVTDERIKYLREQGHIPSAARGKLTGRK